MCFWYNLVQAHQIQLLKKLHIYPGVAWGGSGRECRVLTRIHAMPLALPESGFLAQSDAPVVVLREIVAFFGVRKVGQNELAPAKVLLINLRIPSCPLSRASKKVYTSRSMPGFFVLEHESSINSSTNGGGPHQAIEEGSGVQYDRGLRDIDFRRSAICIAWRRAVPIRAVPNCTHALCRSYISRCRVAIHAVPNCMHALGRSYIARCRAAAILPRWWALRISE